MSRQRLTCNPLDYEMLHVEARLSGQIVHKIRIGQTCIYSVEACETSITLILTRQHTGGDVTRALDRYRDMGGQLNAIIVHGRGYRDAITKLQRVSRGG